VREELEEDGYDPFLVADTFDPDYLEVADALHTYNPVGMITSGVDVHEAYADAAAAAHDEGALFAGTALPGYDDRILDQRTRDGGGYLLAPREDGDMYDETWDAVKSADSDWALVTTWNEWYEGSSIEPARSYGMDYVDLTAHYASQFHGE
jgi:hypothetical protein